MKYFWAQLQGLPGIKCCYPKETGSTKAGWYASHAFFNTEELQGLSLERFVEAAKAEGVPIYPGGNRPLHKHALFSTHDIYGHGRPTASLYLPEGVDLRHLTGELPETDRINSRIFGEPWFKHYRPEEISRYAEGLRKVLDNYEELLPGDERRSSDGNWALTHRKG